MDAVELTQRQMAALPEKHRGLIAQAQCAADSTLRLADAVDIAFCVLATKPAALKRVIRAACAVGAIDGALPRGRSDYDIPREGFRYWLEAQRTRRVLHQVANTLPALSLDDRI